MSAHLKINFILICLFVLTGSVLADEPGANILCADYQNNHDGTWTTLKPVKATMTTASISFPQGLRFGPRFAMIDDVDLAAFLEKKCGHS